MGGLKQNDDNDDALRGGGWGVQDLNDDMMTQHNNVAAAMIYHPFLMICIVLITRLSSINLSIIAPFIAGLCLGSSWVVAGSILS